MDLKGIKIGSEPICGGSLVSINRDTVRLTNGNESKYVVIRHPGAASVLAEAENGKIVLVCQWRYAVGEVILELPAGKLNVAGEGPAECALHELAEETLYTTDGVELLHTFYTTAGFCDEKVYLYQARGVHLDNTLSNNEDKITETVLTGHEAVKVALESDEIHDTRALVGLQCWLIHARQYRSS